MEGLERDGSSRGAYLHSYETDTIEVRNEDVPGIIGGNCPLPSSSSLLRPECIDGVELEEVDTLDLMTKFFEDAICLRLAVFGFEFKELVKKELVAFLD